MKKLSYLVVLDGSAESLAAAHAAWSLAAETGATVDAQYVIDTESIWKFLAYEHAGFVGSGVFVEARDKITEALQAMAETVAASYRTQVEGRGLEFNIFIDKGVPADEVARRAENYSLVVCGYHCPITHSEREPLAERIAEKCATPVLAVRSMAYGWSRMHVFLTAELADAEVVRPIYSIAAWMGMAVEVVLSPEVRGYDPDSYLIGGWSRAFGVEGAREANLAQLVRAAGAEDLLVIGTAQLDGRGEKIKDLLRVFLAASDRRAVLLWPKSQTRELASSR